MGENDIDIRKALNRKTLGKLYKKKCYFDPKTGYYRFNNSNLYVHIWIMEKKLGRKLRQGEIVRHMNGNKLDNIPSNLTVFGDKEGHIEWHQEQLEVSGIW